MRAINLQSTEITLSTTPNAVSNGLLVRCVIASGTALVTRTAALGTGTASCTIISSEPTYIFKDPSDTLTASGSVLATSIAFMY